eukprot:scaffold27618_cov58-Phaeocystis_antarctica.AAC.1
MDSPRGKARQGGKRASKGKAGKAGERQKARQGRQEVVERKKREILLSALPGIIVYTRLRSAISRSS